MKLVVSSSGKSLDADVDPRFGRCRFFIVYDCKTKVHEVLDNEGGSASSGAGVRSAQTVARNGAKAVVTGNVGPKAFQALEAAGLSVITGGKWEACSRPSISTLQVT